MGQIALFRTATPRLRMLTSTQHMSDHKNKLYYGDNLEVLRDYIPDQSADLIYLDPPFNSRQDYNVLFAAF
jgi:adenine-specific DNA methylase